MGEAGAGRAVNGLTLDAGALIGFDRKSVRVSQLLQAARHDGLAIRIPATVVAQAWRGGPRSARIARLLQASGVTVVDLSEDRARAVGVLLAARVSTDVVDGSVVVCAREYGDGVVTSDPDDLHRLDPRLTLLVL